MLIVPGTGFLTDASSSAFGWPYDIFKWSLVAKLCRCRLVYLGVGAGPVYRPLSRWFITVALALADFRSYRDSSTSAYLRDLGFSRASDRVSPDLAFGLSPAIFAGPPAPTGHRPVVGIGVMNPPGRLSTAPAEVHRAYLDTLATFARWLLAHDHDVRVLIGDFAYDAEVLEEFGASLKRTLAPGNEDRVTCTPAGSVEELLSQIATTDLVVATRFHNVLLSLLAGKPVIAISFHHKSVSLMKQMGLSEYSRDISAVDSAWLIERTGALARDAQRVRGLVRQRTDDFRRSLDEQYRLVFADRAGASVPAGSASSVP